jgi:hypothetical protein
MASVLIILSKGIIDMFSKLDDLTKRKLNKDEKNENINQDNDNDENTTLVNESVLYYEPSKLDASINDAIKQFFKNYKKQMRIQNNKMVSVIFHFFNYFLLV